MSCPVGRLFNEKHVTCQACLRQIGNCLGTKKNIVNKAKNIKIKYNAYPVGNKMICLKDLRTPNDWSNKNNGKFIYRNERNSWEKLLINSIYLWGKPIGKRRLEVVRYVKRSQDMIKDITNREGAFKPLEDALKRVGVIIDDRDEFLERLPLEQKIDISFQRVEILLLDI